MTENIDDIDNNAWVDGNLYLETVPPQDAAKTLMTFVDMLERAPPDRRYNLVLSVPNQDDAGPELTTTGNDGPHTARALAAIADIVRTETERLTIDQQITETRIEGSTNE